MRGLFASRATFAVVVGLLVLAIAGGGYAIASGGGKIQACAQKRTHVLYTGKCHKGDKELSWSQVGPAGAAGAAGRQGATGASGATGPSEAFNATAASGPTDIGLSPTFTTVLSLTLPLGSYVLNAEVVAANGSTTTAADVRCTLFSQTDPQIVDTTVVDVPAGSSAAIPLQGVQVTSGSSSYDSLQCRKSANVTMQIGEDPQFTAILVGSIASP
jgi:hypothetical protein